MCCGGGRVLRRGAIAAEDRPPSGAAPLHYVFNQGSLAANQNAAAGLGFNLMDVTSKPVMDALPAGVLGIYWIGNGYNTTCSWGVSDAQVTTIVNANRGDPKFSNIYYISDEPHSLTCPDGPAALADRTALIKSLDPNAKTFALIQWVSSTNEFANFAASVDYLGADPYPCNANDMTTCDFTAGLYDKVQQAVDAVGVSRVVPIYQAFGQECATTANYYRLPTVSETQTIIDTFDSLVPPHQRLFDGTYTWNRQAPACPTLVDANGTGGYPDLQSVYSSYFSSLG